ncbi:MAG: transposase family protein [Rhodanobacter sp.]|nr:MAG: transposase family protein [Rhodanobacter sp.]
MVMVKVPWSAPGTGFTALSEARAISWLKEASIAAGARQLKLSWNTIDGIVQRAVKPGLACRQHKPSKHLGVDETAFRRVITISWWSPGAPPCGTWPTTASRRAWMTVTPA